MKKYKVNGEKYEEMEAREVINLNLSTLIKSNNDILTNSQELSDLIGEEKNQEFNSPAEKMMISTLNRIWDSKIVKEKEENQKRIEKNDLKHIAKDVSKSIKLAEKTYMGMLNLVQMAGSELNKGNVRYACELFDYVRKVLKDSNEIFQSQFDYNQKYIESEQEGSL